MPRPGSRDFLNCSPRWSSSSFWTTSTLTHFPQSRPDRPPARPAVNIRPGSRRAPTFQRLTLASLHVSLLIAHQIQVILEIHLARNGLVDDGDPLRDERVRAPVAVFARRVFSWSSLNLTSTWTIALGSYPAFLRYLTPRRSASNSSCWEYSEKEKSTRS